MSPRECWALTNFGMDNSYKENTMAKTPKKRTKQCCACTAKNSETKLREQNRGYGDAGSWLGAIWVFLKIIIALESLLMANPCGCVLI